MEVQLNELNQGSKKIGLNIHKGKTKYMTNFKSDETIVIENDIIEKVDRYKYLGQTVMMENQTREEVMIRIKAGWSCFGRFKDINDITMGNSDKEQMSVERRFCKGFGMTGIAKLVVLDVVMGGFKKSCSE